MTSYTGGGLGERSPSGGSSTTPLCSLRLTSLSCTQGGRRAGVDGQVTLGCHTGGMAGGAYQLRRTCLCSSSTSLSPRPLIAGGMITCAAAAAATAVGGRRRAAAPAGGGGRRRRSLGPRKAHCIARWLHGAPTRAAAPSQGSQVPNCTCLSGSPHLQAVAEHHLLGEEHDGLLVALPRLDRALVRPPALALAGRLLCCGGGCDLLSRGLRGRQARLRERAPDVPAHCWRRGPWKAVDQTPSQLVGISRETLRLAAAPAAERAAEVGYALPMHWPLQSADLI